VMNEVQRLGVSFKGILMSNVKNVVVWFTNGESRVFGAKKYGVTCDGMVFDTDGGVLFIRHDAVAMVQNPLRKWDKIWDSVYE
jgi:hypothetical protein